MLSKCANPVCSASFRFLHEGKVFSVTLAPRPASKGPADYLWGSPVPRRVEYYWLCDNCSRTMTLVWDHGRVAVRPRSLAKAADVAHHTGIQAA